jgi:tetratricopeptide (TPR) repeat protein
MTTTSRREALDPDALAALEDQRDFLLRSLDDLEAEHAAGDIDEHDYETLRDDYTARAATVLRAIERRNAARAAARPPRRTQRVIAAGAVVVLVGVLAGLFVAQSSGRRAPGEGITGGVDSARSVLAEADQLLAEGEVDEAIARYQDARELDPTNLDVLRHLATAQLQSGDVDAAIATYDDALEIDAGDVESLAYQGSLFHRQGETERALEQLDRAIALDPTFIDAWSFKLAVLEDDGRLDDGLPEITRLAEEGDEDIALAVAEQVATILDPVPVLKVYDAVIEGDPDNAIALTYRGWLGSSGVLSGEPSPERDLILDVGLEFLDRAIEADPDLADPHVFRAIVLHRLGRDDEAADALRAFDATDPPAEMQALVEQFGLRDELGVEAPN